MLVVWGEFTLENDYLQFSVNFWHPYSADTEFKYFAQAFDGIFLTLVCVWVYTWRNRVAVSSFTFANESDVRCVVTITTISQISWSDLPPFVYTIYTESIKQYKLKSKYLTQFAFISVQQCFTSNCTSFVISYTKIALKCRSKSINIFLLW